MRQTLVLVLAVTLAACVATQSAPAIEAPAWKATDIGQSRLREAEAAAARNLTENHRGMPALWDEYFSTVQRSEFETQRAFELRVADIDPEETYYFTFPVASAADETLTDPAGAFAARYDIERKLMLVGANIENRYNHGSSESYVLEVASDSRQEAGVGANAFGLTSEYSISKGDWWYWKVSNWAAFARFNGASLRSPQSYARPSQVIIEVPMEVEGARSCKDKMHVVLGVRFAGRELASTEDVYSAPTIRMPFGIDGKNHYVGVQVVSLAIVASLEADRLLGCVVYVEPTP